MMNGLAESSAGVKIAIGMSGKNAPMFGTKVAKPANTATTRMCGIPSSPRISKTRLTVRVMEMNSAASPATLREY